MDVRLAAIEQGGEVAKGRDSGMPAASQWESFFDADRLLDALVREPVAGDVIEFGCGYGTFTIPAARKIKGTIYALDIEQAMVEATALRAAEAGVNNVVVERRDFLSDGCGRESQSMGTALLFNILHIEDPVRLLQEAHRVLRPGGVAAMIHWNHDGRTPRGPPLEIRPRPEQCRRWGEEAGLSWIRNEVLPGSPWHWGMVMARRSPV